ncbi:MAG: PEP/pyruvate-binding domain-containing protein, partial [Phycisphaerales bacterium]|nr:PEP/pyruvate-binding domain-containing protein [Phycisphaerales bacterium]
LGGVRAETGGGATTHENDGEKPWEIMLEFLRQSDRLLLTRMTRKMLNHLSWNGIEEADALLESDPAPLDANSEDSDENRPLRRREMTPGGGLTQDDLTRRAFDLAGRCLPEHEMVRCIQSWINEEKSRVLTRVLVRPDSGINEISDALRRFLALGVREDELPQAVQTNLRVGLIRSYFVDLKEFIGVAKNHIGISDLHEIVDKLVLPSGSRGKLGGKAAGLLLADHMLRRSDRDAVRLSTLRIPNTWHVASDGLNAFILHNNLEEAYNHKYMDPERVRQDYPHVIQVFKNSGFPPEISAGLSSALDDFGEKPIIVRSSSLLEDRFGASFAGKYKSLFLANQGPKKQRLAALQDAIAEIYASVFGPDPIRYRAERDLLNFNEEMGILIQEVVGKRVGRFFTPAFAGVAFTSNEFRWSPRIKRDDGLLRIVPGLGTRAVDRIGDDYPILIAPGQPALRVNASPEEIVRYAPKMVDVIDLESNTFVTVGAEALLREAGDDYPAARRLISIVEPGRIRLPSGIEPDWESDDFVVTMEGILQRTPFVSQMHGVLSVLREKMGTDVDVEFAHDGEHLYLLQCRSQSRSRHNTPSAIPGDIPLDRLLFSAHRHISNGRVPDLTHVVYVDPEQYSALSDYRELRRVAHAIGRLNSILPKHRFALLGPGRWGSRGDIRLGVGVTYSDISNCAILVEIARASGAYVPELSFGTHFFQDMVESGIRYLPLYPDEEGNAFNESFLRRSTNMLAGLLPEFAGLACVLRVIDVTRETGGLTLQVLMNADSQKAVGLFAEPSATPARDCQPD